MRLMELAEQHDPEMEGVGIVVIAIANLNYGVNCGREKIIELENENEILRERIKTLEELRVHDHQVNAELVDPEIRFRISITVGTDANNHCNSFDISPLLKVERSEAEAIAKSVSSYTGCEVIVEHINRLGETVFATHHDED